MPPTRVLVIDDDEEIREMLREMLEAAGYDVEVASNGRRGLETQRARPVDLVITDIFMPEKEGIETIIELRREFPSVRIIAMSGGGAQGTLDYLPAAEHLGAITTLGKPFDPAKMLATVRRVLDG